MVTESPVPTSAVLIYNLPGKNRNRRDDFEIVMTERRLKRNPYACMALVEGPKRDEESPHDCAIRVMREQTSLVINPSVTLPQEFVGPVVHNLPYGLVALTLFSCNLTETTGDLKGPEDLSGEVLAVHLYASELFYNLAAIGKLDMLYLGGTWQGRIQGVLASRRRKKPR